jgi:hypothetical protein
MSPQRARMIDDMILAGLAEGTRKLYVQAVRRLAAHNHRSPDLLSEEEVRNYLLRLRQRGVARGTFQTGRDALTRASRNRARSPSSPSPPRQLQAELVQIFKSVQV